jgi:GNAT superfamily N-acetyltransferase
MIKYRKLQKLDITPACDLIFTTFKKFNSHDGSPAAVKKYLSLFDRKLNSTEELEKRFARSPIAYVAIDGKKIVGVMRGRPDRLVNLFVNGSRHKHGIGKKLVNIFEAEAKKMRGKIVKIRASLYAMPFYQKMGYRKTTGQRLFHGLKIQPMKKIIK